MDTLFARSLALLFVVVACLFPNPASANNYATYGEAVSACQGYPPPTTTPGTMDCSKVNVNANGSGLVQGFFKTNTNVTLFSNSQTFDGGYSPPSNDPCSGVPTVNVYADGKITKNSSICVNGPTQSGGAQTKCNMTISPAHGSVPTYNSNRGTWETFVTYTPGSVCDGSKPAQDAHGTEIVPAPKLPDVPTINQVPRSNCELGSCYDPGSDEFKASDSAGTLSIVGSQARSSAGGCTSGGDGTVCAGSPNAPSPPAAQIPSPPVQVQSVDTYKQADPVTGSPSVVTVAVYSNGAPTKSGSTSGDSTPSNPTGAPAPASTASDPAKASSAGDNGTYGGGTDCTTPPSCTGDAVACGAATTQWSTTCTIHKDLTGSGTPSDFEGLKTKHSLSEVQFATPSADASLGGQANIGNYDQSGMGYASTCPLVDLQLQLWQGYSVAVPFSKGCVIGPWIRGVVIAMALFSAAMITKGGVS